jgi:uncharacterized protein YbjT (DUF2867 family)
MAKINNSVFIAGGTGYVGQRLITSLVARGISVRTLTRRGSEPKVPSGAEVILGNPLDEESFASRVHPASTWVHLVGVPHPTPRKVEQFKAIDPKSVEVAISVASKTRINHFIYVSVAHPAPMMKAYIEVRTRCEELLPASGMNCTILRPWYVLGPGHRWPYLLLPVYKALELVPATAASARRLGLVRLSEMIDALVHAVENPVQGSRVVEVPEIRALSPR